jgi:hypothetical protein
LSSADEVVKIACEGQLLFGAVKSLISKGSESATEARLLRHRMTRLIASRDERAEGAKVERPINISELKLE